MIIINISSYNTILFNINYSPYYCNTRQQPTEADECHLTQAAIPNLNLDVPHATRTLSLLSLSLSSYECVIRGASSRWSEFASVVVIWVVATIWGCGGDLRGGGEVLDTSKLFSFFGEDG